MKISDLTDQELVSTIERITEFRFHGMAWCVAVNPVPRQSPLDDPDAYRIGITYWGDSNLQPSQSPDSMALVTVEAITAARSNMATDRVTAATGMAVFVGRAALERIVSVLNQQGGSISIVHSKGSRNRG